ncbi:amino acid ABC transporter substrate-binding protein [Clostridium beijerinckii]|nr:amino acid ABC transporter substrate-binding protein [Clostridium beijerinckii]
MRKIPRKLLILIVIINFIVMILEGTTAIDNSKTTTTNNQMEKDRLEEIKGKGEITVDSPLNDITYFYLDTKTNKITGIDADIISEITKRLGINKVKIKESPFSDLLEKLNNDNSIDISVGGIYITPEREELVSFTQPLYKVSEAIVVPTFSKINFKSDLKNAIIGVEKGTVFVTVAEKWKENNLIKDIVIYETSDDVLNAINSNKIDAGIVDSVIVKYSLLKEKNLLIRMIKDYTPEVYGTVGIAIRKNDTTLLNAFNEKINEMKADGTMYAILVNNGLDKANMISNK